MPEFPGGIEEMRKFINDEVSKSTLKGDQKVFLKLLISPEGKILSLDVLNNPKIEYMEVAVKITKKFPDFKPGKQNDKPVYVYYNFPVKFVN
jgi:protein TonB